MVMVTTASTPHRKWDANSISWSLCLYVVTRIIGNAECLAGDCFGSSRGVVTDPILIQNKHMDNMIFSHKKGNKTKRAMCQLSNSVGKSHT
jgi:hypothetical protein